MDAVFILAEILFGLGYVWNILKLPQVADNGNGRFSDVHGQLTYHKKSGAHAT
jgi:hypothetical protein